MQVPKRKPNYVHPLLQEKTSAKPKKWNPFSPEDSKSIETAFHEMSDEDDRAGLTGDEAGHAPGDLGTSTPPKRHDTNANTSIDPGKHNRVPAVKVAVNEDYLFDVEVKRRELGPAYWVGPIYEVRRGTWFDGSSLTPCDENLATQLEEGYLKTKPWRQPQSREQTSQQPRSVSGTAEAPVDLTDTTKDISKESSAEQKSASGAPPPSKNAKGPAPPLLTHRLFGSYMNHTATYQDTSTVWILSDDFMSKVSSAMLQRFVGGSGTRYIRGYAEVLKKKSPKDPKRPTTPTKKDGTKSDKRDSMPTAPPSGAPGSQGVVEDAEAESETRVQSLERQMSSLVSSAMPDDPDKQAEEARKREEKEIQLDYRDTSGEAQDREVEHLILVTHGIGQRLGARFESFNFIHDVNELRKTLKTVYSASADLQALNGEVDTTQKNCRVQVLPICWRHLLDFPRQGVKHNRKEHDITDSLEDDDEYPTLDAITVDGVPGIRNIVADLALDILLYQTPAYKDHISRIVVKECNRILKLFKKRNPTFNGKVSLIGHSLGSAIMFDVLSEQQQEEPAYERSQHHKTPTHHDFRLNFDVEDFFCLGSPVGLFQMLKGRTVGGRGNPNKVTLDGYPDSLDDPFNETPYSKLPANILSDSQREAMISSPKCRQLYNIFHPRDPIGYRLEPLISPAMTSLRPQSLPYTKKNFFGAPMGQGFTGIPAKMGQSFSGFWSNFQSGLTNSFITRSIGFSAEDAARLGASAPTATATQQAQTRHRQVSNTQQIQQSSGAGTNIGGGVITPQQTGLGAADESTTKRKYASEMYSEAGRVEHPPTLIDGEMETLYSGFQKRRKSEQDNDADARDFGDSQPWREAEERGRKLKKEEAKVRALNSNGRVDYSIQEYVN